MRSKPRKVSNVINLKIDVVSDSLGINRVSMTIVSRSMITRPLLFTRDNPHMKSDSIVQIHNSVNTALEPRNFSRPPKFFGAIPTPNITPNSFNIYANPRGTIRLPFISNHKDMNIYGKTANIDFRII